MNTDDLILIKKKSLIHWIFSFNFKIFSYYFLPKIVIAKDSIESIAYIGLIWLSKKSKIFKNRFYLILKLSKKGKSYSTIENKF